MSSQDCQEVEGLWRVAFSGRSELVVPSIIAVGLDVSGERERESDRERQRERERRGGKGLGFRVWVIVTVVGLSYHNRYLY